jgi:hypothetical protein
VYWYYSWFPNDSDFTSEEKVWLNKLNKVGIGYFRPLVVATLAVNKTTTPEERISLFKAIERFIFIPFRLAGYHHSWRISVYSNKARDILNRKTSIIDVTRELESDTESSIKNAISNFISAMNRRFDSGRGFYAWWGLRYFLFEYEFDKAVKRNLEKVPDWEMFSRTEKDKVTIEHILPQTPTNQYWQNMYKDFSPNEVKILSASLGNLLPLSQSINSSLQNDSFPDKKNPPENRRRGYINGSHSEIEVAQESDWTALNILNRGMLLLRFMESRWNIQFTDEQKSELLHIDFVDSRKVMG